ncbi:unnamed protein product, partial [Didymodactylos carnosus]
MNQQWTPQQQQQQQQQTPRTYQIQTGKPSNITGIMQTSLMNNNNNTNNMLRVVNGSLINQASGNGSIVLHTPQQIVHSQSVGSA